MRQPFAGNLLSPLTVALVGALVEGRPNYLAIGYICPFNFARHIFFSIYKGRYTHQGILANRTFSVNIPSVDMMEKIEIAGSRSGRDYDKSSLFPCFYGELKTAPMIETCPITIECQVEQLLEYDQNQGVIGRVVRSYVDERYLADGKPDFGAMGLMVWTSVGGAVYHRLGERL